MQNPENHIAIFKGKSIRKIIYQKEWWFSVVDVIQAITDSPTPRQYWGKVKQREFIDLKSSPIWVQLKLEAADGKKYETDCANTEGMLRIIQSIPSPRVEPLKRWLSNFMNYKHTQIGYLMLVVTLAVAVLFVWAHITASAEPPSADSGTNLLVTVIMASIVSVLASFGSLQVIIDGKYLRIKFGWGIYQKNFSLDDVVSAKAVKNHWYYGWGIRVWLWPKMWIYNVSGFDAVEIKLKNGKTYRIGTDEAEKLKQAILQSIA